MKKKSKGTLVVLLLLAASVIPAHAGTSPPSAGTTVEVAFEGLIVHVLGGGITRAIVPRLGGHQLTITLPRSAKEDVERIFAPLQCLGVCDVPFDGLAFRLVDAQGRPPSTPFVPNEDFRRIVTRLSTVPSADKPFERKEDLVPEIFADAPVADSIVAGFFELAGGAGRSEAFSCPAKFDGETEYKPFPAKVDALFHMPAGSRLQVMKAGSGRWEDIRLQGSHVKIAVRNDLPDTNMSHFDLYALLSVKRNGLGYVDLPEIRIAGPECIAPAFGVPGCSNSAWP